MQKKLALALKFDNCSSTNGVAFGCGPSSKLK
jgi:hypothetical protein